MDADGRWTRSRTRRWAWSLGMLQEKQAGGARSCGVGAGTGCAGPCRACRLQRMGAGRHVETVGKKRDVPRVGTRGKGDMKKKLERWRRRLRGRRREWVGRGQEGASQRVVRLLRQLREPCHVKL